MHESRVTRRTFLRRAGAAGAAVAGGTLWATAPAAARARRTPRADTPIDHLVIACQENRSFDHYYGYAAQVQAAKGFGPPGGYTQPDGHGGSVAPFEFTALSTPDIPHSWTAVHQQWDNGAMDGFYTTDGVNGMGYYTAAELPFYYSLFDNSALCANYFCSLLGPTWPNRFYFAAGTSGGITANGVWGYGVFDYPIILDLLDAAGVTWGVYNMNWDSVPFGNTDNVFVFWKNFAHDQRTRGSRGSFLDDARKGTLPQVSWLVSSFAHQKDEHPPADVSVGMGLQQELITAVRESPLWDGAAYLLTYDEHGGYFDHVKPPMLDAYGLSVRVPLWVVSKHAKKGPVKSRLPAEHSSTLRLIEALYGLPTLASQNHLFDTSTPTGSNYQANGAAARRAPRHQRPARPLLLLSSAAVVEDVRDVRERVERQVEHQEDHSPDEDDGDSPGDHLADRAVSADPLLEVCDRAEERCGLRILSAREAPHRREREPEEPDRAVQEVRDIEIVGNGSCDSVSGMAARISGMNTKPRATAETT